LVNACAIVRSSLSVTQVVGLVSDGALKSPEEVAVGGVAIAPLGGYVDTPWPLRAGQVRQDSGGHSGHGSVRSERPEPLTCHGSGVGTAGVGPRRFAGYSNVPAVARVLAGDR